MLDGYSMELCGGTHTRATGEIGLFRIVSESAVAAGVRRIEAVAGLTAFTLAREQFELIKSIAGKLNTPLAEIEKKLDATLSQQRDLEKALKSSQQREAAGRAKTLLSRASDHQGIPAIVENLGSLDGDSLQSLCEALRSEFPGVIILGSSPQPGIVVLMASVGAPHTAKLQAGKIIQAIAPLVGGKGGGKPDFARGGGKDESKLEAALAHARSLLG